MARCNASRVLGVFQAPRRIRLSVAVLLASGSAAYGCWGPHCPEPGLDGGEQFRITFVSGLRNCQEISEEPLVSFRPGDSFVLTAGKPTPRLECDSQHPPSMGGGPQGPKPIPVPAGLSPFLSQCGLVGATALRCLGMDAVGCQISWEGRLTSSETPRSFPLDRSTTVVDGVKYLVEQWSSCDGSGRRTGCLEWDVTVERIK